MGTICSCSDTNGNSFKKVYSAKEIELFIKLQALIRMKLARRHLNRLKAQRSLDDLFCKSKQLNTFFLSVFVWFYFSGIIY